ncbi:MAG TPA: HAMP domain-containing sensor histidine kinase [Edaphobacter sp.]|nr:HAMP domain-containing sensor histidine kinase [Edaphobacter sp.]
MRARSSITGRLITAVLLLEALAAIALIGAVTVHERKVQYEAFDANLRSNASAIFGAVQDADDVGDNVQLELRGLKIPKKAIYEVTDQRGVVLGSAGSVPTLRTEPEGFEDAKVGGRSYRFFVLSADRIIDPGVGGGIDRPVKVIFGLPDGHVWHEVLGEVRFFAIATLALLSLTAVLMIWLIRKLLMPIHELASAAGEISASRWQFEAPGSAKEYAELRPLATAIEKTIARLQHTFEQQKQFTSDAAHELKTDLAIVKSSLQLLSMKKRTAEEYERGVALGLDDVTRLEQTIHKMLTLSRLEQPQELAGQTCRMDMVLLEAVQQTRPFAELRQIRLESALAAAVAPLDSRDAMLLCSNVLLNALQHSPEGARVEVSAAGNDGKVLLTVRDMGEGVREEERESLFLPFYRGDVSRSRKSGGTGLGLSICKAICDRVGGSIGIGNHPEGGAVVEIVLPAAGEKDQPVADTTIRFRAE